MRARRQADLRASIGSVRLRAPRPVKKVGGRARRWAGPAGRAKRERLRPVRNAERQWPCRAGGLETEARHRVSSPRVGPRGQWKKLGGGWSWGRRVVVVGAARSGLAAAELLAARGARDAVRYPFADRGDALRQRGVTLELASRDGDVRESDLVVARAFRRNSWRLPPRGRTASRSSDRAGVAVAQGPRNRHHRHERQSTTTALTGRMLEQAGYHVTWAETSARR